MSRVSLRWGVLLLLLGLPLAAVTGEVGVRVVKLPNAPTAMPAPVTGQVVGAPMATRVWLPPPGRHPDWYSIRLARDWHGTTPPLLVIGASEFAAVTVYLPPDYRPRKLSVFDSTLDPAFSHRALVNRLPMDLRAEQPIYLQFRSSSLQMACWIAISDAASYHADDLGFVRASTFFASVQVAMVLVILCFLVVLRDRVFLYFVIYASALLLYATAMSGDLFALRIGFFTALGYGIAVSMSALTGVFAIWFTVEFADLRRYTPRLARWMGVIRWPLLVLAILAWLHRLTFSLAGYINWLLAVGVVLILLATWLAWRRGNRQAGFFLLSWVPMLAFTVVRVVQLTTHVALPGWLEFGFPASMAWADLVITVGLADRVFQARRERDQATHLAQFDPLTGALNRRAVMEWLHDTWRVTPSDPTPLAVLFFDLDHFKRINDSHGHAAGDACLVAAVEVIRSELAETDCFGRYGGEEFMAALCGDSAVNAMHVAERIRARVAALQVQVAGRRLMLTVSIGVAMRDADTASPEALVEMADAAQYRAKAEGRNRVVAYSSDLSAGMLLAR